MGDVAAVCHDVVLLTCERADAYCRESSAAACLNQTKLTNWTPTARPVTIS